MNYQNPIFKYLTPGERSYYIGVMNLEERARNLCNDVPDTEEINYLLDYLEAEQVKLTKLISDTRALMEKGVQE